MRRYTAVMLMVLCTGCTQKTKPETQPPPVATAPEVQKPAEATTTTPATTAAKPAPATTATTPAPATAAAKPAPATTATKPAPATTATKPAAPAAAAKTPSPSATKAAPAAKAQAASQTVKAPTTKPQPAPPAKATTAPTLDLEALKTELKDTKAIGLMTKLSLKNKVDDLLDDFRQHHSGKPTPTLAQLRSTYDLLMMKVLSLLQDRDQKLASEIVSSREQIWGLLADPKKFATLPV